MDRIFPQDVSLRGFRKSGVSVPNSTQSAPISPTAHSSKPSVRRVGEDVAMPALLNRSHLMRWASVPAASDVSQNQPYIWKLVCLENKNRRQTVLLAAVCEHDGMVPGGKLENRTSMFANRVAVFFRMNLDADTLWLCQHRLGLCPGLCADRERRIA